MQLNETNNQQLTDEELDQITETLEENRSADDQLILDIINNEVEGNSELESEIIDMTIDNETGELKPIVTSEEFEETADVAVTDIENDVTLTAEDLKDSTENYNLSDEETNQLLELIIKFKMDPEKLDVYNELPASIKEYVDELVTSAKANNNTGITREGIARFIIAEFIKEAELNKQFVDFQEAIEKELQIPSITDMYSEHIKEVMEEKLIETANNIEDEHPDKAKALRDISAMFTESYTFNLMKSTLINNKKAKNHIRESVKDYTKYCNAFNRRNKDIVIKINDVRMVANTLSRVLPETISLDDIKKFVVLFCKTCESLNVKSTVHCSYMYYTIKNILALDHTNERKTDFSTNLINNIIDTIKFILETQEQIESSMPPKLLKAKIKKCSRA